MALAGIVGALMLSRGGMATLMPLVRVLLPVILIVLAFNFLKNKLMAGGAGKALREKMEEAMRQAQQQQQGKQGKVIDLCPKCGTYLAPGHRCKTS
jgi:hypothetical protein